MEQRLVSQRILTGLGLLRADVGHSLSVCVFFFLAAFKIAMEGNYTVLEVPEFTGGTTIRFFFSYYFLILNNC